MTPNLKRAQKLHENPRAKENEAEDKATGNVRIESSTTGWSHSLQAILYYGP